MNVKHDSVGGDSHRMEDSLLQEEGHEDVFDRVENRFIGRIKGEDGSVGVGLEEKSVPELSVE